MLDVVSAAASIVSVLVALYAFRRKRAADQRLQALHSVPEHVRARLVEIMLDPDAADTAGLSRYAQMRIVEEKIRVQAERLRLVVRIAIALAVLCGAVAIGAWLAGR